MTAALIFLLSVGFVVYVLAGYPLLLALLARLRPRPLRKRPWAPSVDVLLAVKDGERWLAAKLESILALDYPKDKLRVIVISDGSSDATDSIAAEYASRGVELLRTAGGGKAAALNAGLRQATAEVIFFTDVRQELAPRSLRELTACLADPDVGAASGELVIRDAETREEANVGAYWRYEKAIRKRLSALDSVLGATGCIYAMKREFCVEMPPGTLVDDMHLPLAAFFRGKRVILEGEARAYDYPTPLDSEFRRKVRTLAGNYQILRHYPQLLGPRNRMWLHFMSHKFGRLLLPFALIAAAVSSFFLPEPFNWLALGGQAAFYGAAIIDPLVPERSPLRKITSPVRVFVVMMAAAFCATSILFGGGRYWTETRVSAPQGERAPSRSS